METASLERSITRLPPSTGFDEPLAAEPEPELEPEPAPTPVPQPARTNGTAARAAAAERRTFLFITFLGCHERALALDQRGETGAAALRRDFPNPSPLVPNVTIDHDFFVYVTFGNTRCRPTRLPSGAGQARAGARRRGRPDSM